MNISDYDKFNYDYSEYWKDREYENISEHIVLEKIFNEVPSGIWFLDIGGSYGRLTDTYYKRFKHPIVLDYSLQTLIKNKDILLNKYPNIILIAANAYKLPFADSSVDSALMVRVLHHLNEPEIYFKEIGRILKSNGTYIQEFANKIHIKARVRALLKGNLTFFNKEPYQQPSLGSFEGTINQQSIFLNYHPNHIKKLFKEANIKIYKKYGCSYLRSKFLKDKLKTSTLIKIESIFQKLFSWTNLPPSIFFVGRSKKRVSHEKRYNFLNEILICPKCKGNLIYSEGTAKCTKCKKIYLKDNDIWDFRVN